MVYLIFEITYNNYIDLTNGLKNKVKCYSLYIYIYVILIKDFNANKINLVKQSEH